MPKPFSVLPRFFDKTSKRIDRGVNTLVKRMAKAAGTAAILTTRVDKGLARSNYQATLDVPASGVIPAFAPGQKLGISETGNASGAMAQHDGVIKLFSTKTNRSIFFTNNVPYIGFLNDGSRTVPPGNMSRHALQAAIVTAKGTRVLRC